VQTAPMNVCFEGNNAAAAVFDFARLAGTPIPDSLFFSRGDRSAAVATLLPPKRGIAAMTKLELLYTQKSEKFDQLCAIAARELGYGELSTLRVEGRIRLEDEAKQYVEQWEEMVEMRTSSTIRPITPLRRLLAEYHDLCERILDEHDIVAGILAYRKGAQKRRRSASV
jgi:hypothetical protein